MQFTGHTSTQDLSLTPMQGSAITNGMSSSESVLAPFPENDGDRRNARSLGCAPDQRKLGSRRRQRLGTRRESVLPASRMRKDRPMLALAMDRSPGAAPWEAHRVAPSSKRMAELGPGVGARAPTPEG